MKVSEEKAKEWSEAQDEDTKIERVGRQINLGEKYGWKK